MIDIENSDNKVLEGIFNYNILKMQYNIIPDYFYFCDDNGSQCSGFYYINKQSCSVTEMQKIDILYSDFMKRNNIKSAIPVYNDNNELITFYPVGDKDKILTVK